MLLKNLSILLGRDLKYIPTTNVKISNGHFKRIQPNIHPSAHEESVDCEGLLLIPGFVNAHTHIGDSIAKDITLNSTVDERIHPVFGAKPKVLKNSLPKHLSSFMKNTCKSMISKGITTFVDFREGGIDGILLFKEAISSLPIRSIVLGRVEFYQNKSQIKKNEGFPKNRKSELEEILRKCDGLGISGANENSNSTLKFYSQIKKLRAIHSSETIQSVEISRKNTKKSETIRALQLKPHFLVHMTHASKSDLHLASKKTNGIVVCPRANAALAEGIPDIDLMLRTNCNVAIGTDNVMINSPDMFREMDYLWKATMGIHKKRIDPKNILKMATVNAGKLLKKNIGVIESDKLADCIFIDKHSIDLEPIHSPYASIVHRASESSIRAVMIGGKVVHGKI